MKAFGLAALIAIVAAALAVPFPSDRASAGMNVNINIGPPAVVVAEPPEMIPVPQSMVYYAPGVSVELLFFNGYWWAPNQGHWFRSASYRGPWVSVGPRAVPAAIVHLPPDYRTVYVHEKHVPYGQLKKHYRERDDDRRAHRGEWDGPKKGHKEGHGKEFKGRDRGHGRDDRHGDGDRDGDRDREHGRGGRGH